MSLFGVAIAPPPFLAPARYQVRDLRKGGLSDIDSAPFPFCAWGGLEWVMGGVAGPWCWGGSAFASRIRLALSVIPWPVSQRDSARYLRFQRRPTRVGGHPAPIWASGVFPGRWVDIESGAFPPRVAPTPIFVFPMKLPWMSDAS